MTTKPETKDQKWQERLREDLVKRLLLEGVEITMSVAKELDEFINVSVGKEIAKAEKRELDRVRKLIAGEILKTQMNADLFRGDGTDNVELTIVEYQEILGRITNYLKK